MASIKIVLRTNKIRKDGTSPLAIRITKDRKTRFIFTGQYILEKDWNKDLGKVKKTHPNSMRLNRLLAANLLEANDKLLESELSSHQTSATEIKNQIKRTYNGVSFYDLASQRIQQYQDKGTFSVANAEQSIVNNLKKFTKGNDLLLTEISPSFLDKYKVFCISVLKHKKRTMTNQLIFIRTIYNIALKEKLVDQKHYPFAGDNEKIRLGSGLKIGLTREEIQKIEDLELEPETQIWHTRNVWLFAFYFAGVRISDVLKMTWQDFQDGRLLYVMNKNEKPVSLKTPDKAQAILNHYKTTAAKNTDYIFPYLAKANPNDPRDIFTKSRNATRLLNKYLKRIAEQTGITKNLSNHIARHSFGNLAGDAINPLMLQKLYRHSDLKTTINYQANFIHKDADDALDSVITGN